MPVFNQHFVAKTPDGRQVHSPSHIAHIGPVVKVQIGVTAAFSELLQKNGEIVPSPIIIDGLLDTGASRTTLHVKVIEKLGITPVQEVEVLSVNRRVKNGVYPVSITLLMGQMVLESKFFPVIGSDLSGQPIQALVGRDILSKGIFIYNGAGGLYTLAF